MLAVERSRCILETLKQNKVVMVGELSRQMEVSEETVRKDLEKLEKQHLLCRVHGGAYLQEGYGREATVSVRSQIYREEKDLLAEKSMNFLMPNDTVFLDCSTTAVHLAEKLVKRNWRMTVITNSIAVASQISAGANIRLLMLGGKLDRDLSGFFGQVTIEEISRYHGDKCFISSAGISVEHGITDYTQRETDVRQAMIRQSGECYYVADATKIGRQALYVTENLKTVTRLIADWPAGSGQEELRRKLKELEIPVTLCRGKGVE